MTEDIIAYQSVNQSVKNLSEQMQEHCSHCTSVWENRDILQAGKWQWKKVSFKFMFNVDSEFISQRGVFNSFDQFIVCMIYCNI